MARLVLSECGIRPLNKNYPKPISRVFSSKPINIKPSLVFSKMFISCHSNPLNNKHTISSRDRKCEVKVSAPLHVTSPIENDLSVNNGEFDAAKPPPFKLSDIKNAIPKHCFVKDTWRSMSYVIKDVCVVFGLAIAASSLNNWLVWPLYWFAQGTMFWALFVLGHECGHGSFSSNLNLNSIVGHIIHSSILVPYNGWRISHRTHHQNHGHVENDESWYPLSEKVYKSMDGVAKKLRFILPFPMLAWPVYLFTRCNGKTGSHFHPESDLFTRNERKDVLTSTTCWSAMVVVLAGLSFVMGPIQVLKLYGVPYVIFAMLLEFVTYLHHHGHEDQLPWYRGEEWSYLRGALTTLDRDYGWINNIHHDIGTHVIHHLFPQIPHYHLVEATKAAKPVLGKYYREPKKSAPLPLHLLSIVSQSLKKDHYVKDKGNIVYYQTDSDLFIS